MNEYEIISEELQTRGINSGQIGPYIESVAFSVYEFTKNLDLALETSNSMWYISNSFQGNEETIAERLEGIIRDGIITDGKRPRVKLRLNKRENPLNEIECAIINNQIQEGETPNRQAIMRRINALGRSVPIRGISESATKRERSRASRRRGYGYLAS